MPYGYNGKILHVDLTSGELEVEEPGEVFAAGVLALESGDPSRIEKVLEVGCSTPELERGLISALGWTSTANTPNQVARLVAASEPAGRRLGIAACAIRREDTGARLAPLLARPNPFSNTPVFPPVTMKITWPGAGTTVSSACSPVPPQ